MKKFIIGWSIATIVLAVIFAVMMNLGMVGDELELGSSLTQSSGIPKEDWVFFGLLPSWDVIGSMDAFGEFMQSGEFDNSNPAFLSFVAALVTFVGMTVIGMIIFFTFFYPRWITNTYGPKIILTVPNLIACALAGFYMIISYFFPSWTTSWGILSMADTDGRLIYDNWLMVSRIGLLASPALVLCFIRSIKITKNPFYSVLAVITVWLYALIVAVVSAWAILIAILLFGMAVIGAILTAIGSTRTEKWIVDDYGNKIRRVD
jgi:hypothetical protein